MPSSPRKQTKGKAREVGSQTVKPKPKPSRDSDDTEDSDNLPPLVDDGSSISLEGNSDPDGELEQEMRATTNGESVEMWLDMSKAARERHMRVMKIYLLSPFLFGIVEQEDKWINWAFDCGLLSSNSIFERSSLSEEYFLAVDMVEDAFDKFVKNMLAKEDSDDIIKCIGMMDKVNTVDKLDKAITCAESFTLFGKIRDKIKSSTKKKGDVALLLGLQQAYDHIRKLTRENIDLAKQYDENCRRGEKMTADKKKQGNTHFQTGKYKAAISAYTLAINMGPLNYILYGNRSQSYLKSGDLRKALVDGRRAVVLKPDWTKAQYRYAQAFFALGDTERAITTNRAAKKVCTGRDNKDLDTQYEKFMSQRVGKNKSMNGTPTKSPHVVSNDHSTKKSTTKNSLEDLPELVDPKTSDTSGESCDLDDEDDMPDMISEDSVGGNEGPPQLVTESSSESDSDDVDSHCSRKHQEEERKKLKQLQQRQAKLEKEVKAKKIELKKEEKKSLGTEHGKKKREKLKDEHKEQTAAQKKRELMNTLKQGTTALLDGKHQTSVRYYNDALDLLSPGTFEKYEIKQIDYMLILYAHGTACLETGIYKELLEAIRQFETIIIQYKEIKFPLAFYGLGRVYRRQNRFMEALEPLNQGLCMINSGEEFGVYRWPASQIIIEDTKPGKLKIAFEAIISVCRHPPRADAVCRYSVCTGRTQIYLTDPDYKGFVRLVCDESCKVDYHLGCWKKLKSSYQDKAGDKDFLEDECMTPDCEAPVERIQIFSDSKLKTEFTSSAKLEGKQIKHGKAKTPCKLTKHEKHRKEREEIKVEQQDINQNVEEERKVEEPPPSQQAPKPKAGDDSKAHNEDNSSTENAKQKPEAKKPTDENQKNLSNQQADTGVYILKKIEEKADELVPPKGVKSKSKKKKPKNTQSLDEFLKDLGGEVFTPALSTTGEDSSTDTPLHMPYGIPPPEWCQQEMDAPFVIPPELQRQHQAIEAEFHSGTNPTMFPVLNQTQPEEYTPSIPQQLIRQPETDVTLDYLLSMFQEVLSAHGPLDVADYRIVEPVSYLPDSYQNTIENSGGLKQFFSNSGRFVVKGNMVMLPEDLEFQEIIKKVNPALAVDGIKKSRNFSLDEFNASLYVNSPGHQIETDSNMENGGKEISPHKRSPLNPTSKEFYPTGLSLTDIESDLKATANATSASTQVIASKQTGNVTMPIANNMSDFSHGNDFIEWLVPPAKEEDLSNSVVNAPLPTDLMTNPSVNLQAAATTEDMETNTESLNPNEGSELKTGSDDSDASKSSPKSSSSHDNGVLSPPRHTRAGSNGSDAVIGMKCKGVQTQPQVKAKGVMTDPLVEPFKSEYLKVVQEKEELFRKNQDVQDKLNSLQNKLAQDLEKIKKKLLECQQEKEKLAKEVQSSKHDVKQELGKLRDDCEDKRKLAISLEGRFKTEEERYKTTIQGLQDELTGIKAELSTEKAKWSTDNSQKDEAVKKMTTLKQQQEARAQDAEIKLLELRRDVGLRFLERAFQEAHITVNNLMTAYQARNPAVAAAKFDEVISSWRTYANETHKKIIQCKNSFDGQIQELQNGRALSALPQLPIPGPAQYPGPPILQPLGPQGQMQQPPPDNKPPTTQQQAPTPMAGQGQPPQGAQAVAAALTAKLPQPQPTSKQPPQPASKPPPQPTPKQPLQAAKSQPQPVKAPPSAKAAAPQGPKPMAQGPKMPSQPPKPPAEVPHPTAPVAGAAIGSAAELKSRPSNSFEKIMLRLSTMYPHFSRSDLTSFIKEVRQKKHGTLTGLSLEEIVASVAGLVEAKQKVGLLRAPVAPVATAGPPRNMAPLRYPSQAANNNPPTAKPPRPPSLGASLELDDDDPCVICHEDMRSDTVTLECGHKYHNPCIRKWLMGEQSTCPTCRVHALLPDEFPRLR